MVKKITLLIICILAIIITILGSITYIYLHKKTEAINTEFIWCYDNWKCKAPSSSSALTDFNLLYPNTCSNVNCSEGQQYDASEKGPLSEEFRKKCSPEGKEFNDANFVVVDKEKGCQCMNGSNPCTIEDLQGGTIESCAEHLCGVIPKTCTTFKIKLTDDTITEGINDWSCDGTSGSVNDIKDFCSYMCQSHSQQSNDFYNKFIFGLKK